MLIKEPEWHHFFSKVPHFTTLLKVAGWNRLGDLRNKCGVMFGKTNAKIIASENLTTASRVVEAPITTKSKKITSSEANLPRRPDTVKTKNLE